MTKNEVLQEINQLSLEERLTIIELLVHQLRKELAKQSKSENDDLSSGAKALLADYQNDEELTIFTQLDSEDFHAKS